MIIDWFTISAQALNFLILVWLMKRFLYKPILNAIDAREKLISDKLANAENTKSDAQKMKDEFKRKNDEFDKERSALFKKATDEAQAERERLLNEARKAADGLTAKRQEMLINDMHNLKQSIRRRVQQEVFVIARKVLADLATTGLEERMIAMFTVQLKEMGKEEREVLAKSLNTSSNSAIIRSAFELSGEQRTVIQNALNVIFSTEIKINFETASELISGIELIIKGQKIAWSVEDYLTTLEKAVTKLVNENKNSEMKRETKEEKVDLNTENPKSGTNN